MGFRGRGGPPVGLSEGKGRRLGWESGMLIRVDSPAGRLGLLKPTGDRKQGHWCRESGNEVLVPS